MRETIAFLSSIAGRNSIRYLLDIHTLIEYLNFLKKHLVFGEEILIEIVYGLGNFAGDEIDVRDVMF